MGSFLSRLFSTKDSYKKEVCKNDVCKTCDKDGNCTEIKDDNTETDTQRETRRNTDTRNSGGKSETKIATIYIYIYTH